MDTRDGVGRDHAITGGTRGSSRRRPQPTRAQHLVRFGLVFVPIAIIVVSIGLFIDRYSQPAFSGALSLLEPTTVQAVPHDLPEHYAPVHRGSVNVPTGLYIRRDEDLVLRGTPPFVLSRTYLSKDMRSRAFGIGTSHAFEWFLVGDSRRFQEVAIIREDGSPIPFARTSSGTSYKNAMFEVREPGSEFYGAQLGWTGLDWVMRAWDGSLARFEACAGNDKPRPCGLVLLRDGDGHVIQGRRDALGRLLRIEASSDRWLAFDYDAAHRVTRAYDPTGRQVVYSYDARGFLTKVTSHDGVQRLYTYTEAGLLHTVTEPEIFLENTYDHNGRCIRQINRFPGRDRPFVFDFSYLVDNDRVRQSDVRRSDGTWTSSTYADDGTSIEDRWGRDGTEPTTVTYERDPTSSVVTALRLTCTSRGGMRRSYRRSMNGNADDVIFDVLRTHCGWASIESVR